MVCKIYVFMAHLDDLLSWLVGLLGGKTKKAWALITLYYDFLYYTRCRSLYLENWKLYKLVSYILTVTIIRSYLYY